MAWTLHASCLMLFQPALQTVLDGLLAQMAGHSMVCLSASVLITTMNPAETAELIEMPWGRGRLAWAPVAMY